MAGEPQMHPAAKSFICILTALGFFFHDEASSKHDCFYITLGGGGTTWNAVLKVGLAGRVNLWFDVRRSPGCC
jgi:hypothetical protein